ncbi:MAG TPA: lysophospholipid acyltransferase family protein [Burkholderiaceae bacterium]|nr:lysophospholipid acyltransferase family protein [Burkholderiaceae bacterium]
MTLKSRLLHSLFQHFGHLSFAGRRRWARALAWLAPWLLRKRAHIVRTNLALAFPELSDQQRRALFRRHFRLLAQSVVDRGLLWFGSEATIRHATPIRGLERLEALLEAKRPILLLAPHFIGLDAAATRLTLFLKESATLYSAQRDPVVDDMVRKGRGRFNRVYLINRKDGIRPLVRYLRRGIPVYYLPDMDFGRQGATFAPFFDVPAATLLATAQIARTWNPAVVPIVTRLDPDTSLYHVDVLPALEDFPGDDSNEAATARLNRHVEAWVRPDPAQYYWVHRRYKTRPSSTDKKPY